MPTSDVTPLLNLYGEPKLILVPLTCPTIAYPSSLPLESVKAAITFP